MNQKLSDWASIAEIISGVAVVVTLVFLIVGIRENTAVTSSAMTATALQEFSDVQAAVMADPELTRIYNVYLFGDVASLNEIDSSRLTLFLTVLLNAFDSAYLMSENDLIEVGLFGGGLSIVCSHYQRVKDSFGFLLQAQSREFIEFLEMSCTDQ